MEFNIRKLSPYFVSEKYNVKESKLDDVISIFNDFVKDNIQYPYSIYIKNEQIVKGDKLIFAFKNLDKIFINKENLNIHLDKNCKNSFCFKTITKSLQDIIYERKEKYKTENSYGTIEDKSRKEWEKYKHLLWEFDRKVEEYALSENFKEIRDIAVNCYQNFIIVVDLY